MDEPKIPEGGGSLDDQIRWAIWHLKVRSEDSRALFDEMIEILLDHLESENPPAVDPVLLKEFNTEWYGDEISNGTPPKYFLLEEIDAWIEASNLEGRYSAKDLAEAFRVNSRAYKWIHQNPDEAWVESEEHESCEQEFEGGWWAGDGNG